MRILFLLAMMILLFTNCKQESKYKKLYPFFENIYIDNFEKTVRMNNFISNKNRNGLEYLLDLNGNIIESRIWKNNYLNGYTIRYATNNKPMIIGYMQNDTLNGNYFLLDTLDGSVIEYREVLNKQGMIDNQIMLFKNGKIDYDLSEFLQLKRVNKNKYKINFYSRYKYPYLQLYVLEKNVDSYTFDTLQKGEFLDCESNSYCIYQESDSTAKYLTGYLLSYRHPTLEEIKNGSNEKDKIGPIKYFKFKK